MTTSHTAAEPSPVGLAAPTPGSSLPNSDGRPVPRAQRSVRAHGGGRRWRGLLPPSEAEVARMVAEFLAHGGHVTVCPTAHVGPVRNGAGREGGGWTT